MQITLLVSAHPGFLYRCVCKYSYIVGVSALSSLSFLNFLTGVLKSHACSHTPPPHPPIYSRWENLGVGVLAKNMAALGQSFIRYMLCIFLFLSAHVLHLRLIYTIRNKTVGILWFSMYLVTKVTCSHDDCSIFRSWRRVCHCHCLQHPRTAELAPTYIRLQVGKIKWGASVFISLWWKCIVQYTRLSLWSQACCQHLLKNTDNTSLHTCGSCSQTLADALHTHPYVEHHLLWY